MAIKLSAGGFQLIPEGYTVFKITGVNYDPVYGKMKIDLQTKNGLKHKEQYTLLNARGEVNEKALNAFSFFAKTVLDDFSVEEIEETDLIGHYIGATVAHEEFESNKEPGKMLKSARLKDYQVEHGFGGSVKPSDDLDDFLDD